MIGGVILAVVSTLTLDGSVARTGGDYATIEFEMPEGIAEVEIVHSVMDPVAILDFGLFDPDGFRGWSGGLTAPIVVGDLGASRGYLAGTLTPGTWKIVIGKAKIVADQTDYAVSVILRDAPTIAPDPVATCELVGLETGARWYAGDFHVHSSESGDASATMDEIADVLRERGLDFAFLTDHNTVSGRGPACEFQSQSADVLLLPASEVTTYGGHGNAFGISQYVDHRIGENGRTIADVIADVHNQGGLFSVNHPALALGAACIGCPWDHGDDSLQGIDAIELHTGSYEVSAGTFTPQVIAIWDRLLDSGLRVTALAGSDDHRAGKGTGGTDSAIGSPTTMVYATALSEEALLAAVKEGRVFIKLRGPDDPNVELTVTTDRDETGAVGDTVVGAKATISVEVSGGQGLAVVVYQDGSQIHRETLTSNQQTVTIQSEVPEAGARLRAHVVDASLDVVITNHVYMQYEKNSSSGGCSAGRGNGGGGLPMLVFLALVLYRFQAKRSWAQ